MTDSPDAPWDSVETRFDAIHSAARMRDVETVQRELENGVHVDVLNGRAANGDGGNTALWFAAQGASTGGLDVARVLIAAGADMDRRCEHGRTALHPAAAWGHLDVVTLLVENGADPIIRDENNQTPRELAQSSQRVSSEQLKPVVAVLEAIEALQTGKLDSQLVRPGAWKWQKSSTEERLGCLCGILGSLAGSLLAAQSSARYVSKLHEFDPLATACGNPFMAMMIWGAVLGGLAGAVCGMLLGRHSQTRRLSKPPGHQSDAVDSETITR